MHEFFKSHHHCYAYMAVQNERKSTFYLHLTIGKKRPAACLLHNIDIAVVSECLCHLRAQYSVQFPDICIGLPPSVNNGVTAFCTDSLN